MSVQPDSAPPLASPPAAEPAQRRARANPWFPVSVCVLAVAAVALGVLTPQTAVVVLGLALAGIAGPSRGPKARTLTRSRRTTLAVAAITGAGALSTLLLAQELLVRSAVLAMLATVAAVPLLGLPFAMSQSQPGTASTGRVTLTRRNLVLALTGALVVLSAHAGGISFVALITIAVLVPVAVLAQRLWTLRRRGARIGPWQAANELAFWGLLALAAMAGTFDVLSMFGLLPGDSATVRMVVLALCGLGGAVALLPRRRALLATNVMVLAGSAFLATQLAGIHLAPPQADSVTLPSPVRGEWYVGHGGRAELVNGHRAALMQSHALDIVQFEDGSTRDGAADVLESYHAYGEPVVSPTEGRVVTAVDGRPDQAIGTTDAENPAGNHVVVAVGDGRYVALAHLRPGSIEVSVGDRVRPGQRIGEVGNSGNTSEPHLHLQIQNVAELDVLTPPKGARSYPWLISDVTVTRSGETSQQAAADLRRGDRFAN